jgi:hypothetical protein
MKTAGNASLTTLGMQLQIADFTTYVRKQFLASHFLFKEVTYHEKL